MAKALTDQEQHGSVNMLQHLKRLTSPSVQITDFPTQRKERMLSGALLIFAALVIAVGAAMPPMDRLIHMLLAANGRQALSLLAETTAEIDMVVTDVVMPEMSGKVLVQRLRQRWPQLPVLYMSGYTNDLIQPGDLIDKHVEFLPKPFGPHELGRVVRRLLDGA